MKTALEEHLEKLTQRLAELYFIKRDYTELSVFLSDKISWMGTSEYEICSGKKEVLSFLADEIKEEEGDSQMDHVWTRGIELDEDCVVVMAAFTVMKPTESLNLEGIPLRFSILWVKEKNQWKIVHIHHSVADQHQKETAYFNMEAAKNAYSQMNDKLVQAIHTDALTGINNMQGFIEDTEQLFHLYPNDAYAIVKFGIKNFRYINRTSGYSTGDKVLRHIAKNLKETCHEGETCGRIEKDIFAMTLRFFTKREMYERLESKIRLKLNDQALCEKIHMEIQFTGGVYLPEDIQHEHVMDMLDKALIAQQSIPKNLAGSQLVYYEKEMMEAMIHKNKLLESVAPAIQNGEFMLYIQPQFAITTKEIVSGEALCRWKKSDGTLVAPNDFIPTFEEYGMIINFDFHMLEILCRQMRLWLDQGIELLPISINQSRLHIGDETYFEDFCATVDRYQLPHKYICFELTESAFVEQQDDMLELARELHEQGFLLAIDDFGTGYASLNFLSVVSADLLKIDKCLLDGIENSRKSRTIIEKTIELAHEIEMTVICEGIEKEQQLEYLGEIGCDIGQGFLVGKPMTTAEFYKQYLRQRKTQACTVS